MTCLGFVVSDGLFMNKHKSSLQDAYSSRENELDLSEADFAPANYTNDVMSNLASVNGEELRSTGNESDLSSLQPNSELNARDMSDMKFVPPADSCSLQDMLPHEAPVNGLFNESEHVHSQSLFGSTDCSSTFNGKSDSCQDVDNGSVEVHTDREVSVLCVPEVSAALATSEHVDEYSVSGEDAGDNERDKLMETVVQQNESNTSVFTELENAPNSVSSGSIDSNYESCQISGTDITSLKLVDNTEVSSCDEASSKTTSTDQRLLLVGSSEFSALDEDENLQMSHEVQLQTDYGSELQDTYMPYDEKPNDEAGENPDATSSQNSISHESLKLVNDGDVYDQRPENVIAGCEENTLLDLTTSAFEKLLPGNGDASTAFDEGAEGFSASENSFENDDNQIERMLSNSDELSATDDKIGGTSPIMSDSFADELLQELEQIKHLNSERYAFGDETGQSTSYEYHDDSSVADAVVVPADTAPLDKVLFQEAQEASFGDRQTTLTSAFSVSCSDKIEFEQDDHCLPAVAIHKDEILSHEHITVDEQICQTHGLDSLQFDHSIMTGVDAGLGVNIVTDKDNLPDDVKQSIVNNENQNEPSSVSVQLVDGEQQATVYSQHISEPFAETEMSVELADVENLKPDVNLGSEYGVTGGDLNVDELMNSGLGEAEINIDIDELVRSSLGICDPEFENFQAEANTSGLRLDGSDPTCTLAEATAVVESTPEAPDVGLVEGSKAQDIANVQGTTISLEPPMYEAVITSASAGQMTVVSSEHGMLQVLSFSRSATL